MTIIYSNTCINKNSTSEKITKKETKYNKVLYIGAGTDLEPTDIFKNVKTFIYVDIEPSSCKNMNWKFWNKYGKSYNSNFIQILIKTFQKYGFLLNSKIPETSYVHIREEQKQNLIYFFNAERNQEIYYYVNTSIPEDYDKITDAIKNYTILYISGFFPNKIIMKDIKPDNPIIFAGVENNVYSKEYACEGTKINDEDPENIIAELHTNPYIKSCFSEFYSIMKDYYVDEIHSNKVINEDIDNDRIKLHATLLKHNTWDDFYQYYLDYIVKIDYYKNDAE
jgi:hypothetical protein